MTTRLTPTNDQAEALQRFADSHGRTWKSHLCQVVWPGDLQLGPDDALLRQVRNTLGPSWLMRSCKIKPRATTVADEAPDPSGADPQDDQVSDLDDTEAEAEAGEAIDAIDATGTTGAVPVVLVTCPACPTGHLVEAEGGLGHTCSACPHTDLFCDGCGARMTFAADHRATTCGGLAIVGARACVPCGVYLVCRRSRPADAVDWVLAKGGRSLTAGGVKIRADAGRKDDVDVEAIMARIVRVPELEIEVERLRAQLAERRS